MQCLHHTCSCPTECRLAYSTEAWKCLVTLRFTTDETGQPLGRTRNETFGPPILNKPEVEERIRRAQRAILNPSQPSRHFLEGDEETATQSELTFSTNCISLQISGQDVADLSFCDLPGECPQANVPVNVVVMFTCILPSQVSLPAWAVTEMAEISTWSET